MDCDEIRKIIPQYFNLTATADDVKKVEEHLCVCHDCRTALGELMDKASDSEKSPEKEPQENLTSQEIPEINPQETVEAGSQAAQAPSIEDNIGKETELSSGGQKEMEYFSGDGMSELVEEPKSELSPEKDESEPKPPAEISPESPELPVDEKEEPSTEPETPLLAETNEEPVAKDDSNIEIEEEREPSLEEKPELSTEEDSELPSEEKEDKSIEEKIEPLAEEVTEPLIEENPEPTIAKTPHSSIENINKDRIGLLEYLSLAVGIGILGFFIYLFIKG